MCQDQFRGVSLLLLAHGFTSVDLRAYFSHLLPYGLAPPGEGPKLVVMALAARRWIGIGVILTVTSACDNVGWGGVDYTIVPPSTSTDSDASAGATAPGDTTLQPLELERLLYLVERTGGETRMMPVAQLGSDGLLPLPASMAGEGFPPRLAQERMSPHSRFTLFHWGERVGTFTAGEDWDLDSSLCLPRPRRSGRVELLPEAADAQRFLALEEGRTEPLGRVRSLASTYEQRVGSLNLATSLIARLEAPWPPSVLEIRRDLQIVPMGDSSGDALGLSGTFVYGDDLSTAAPGPNAYTIFYLASPQDDAFQAGYAWYHRSRAGSKAAPRTLSWIPFPGSNREEWILEVFGDGTRWLASIGRSGEEWVPGFSDVCAQVPVGRNAVTTP